jgi:hypothetical protein
LVFIADFVLILTTCLASFIKIIHGKEYKMRSPRYGISYSLLSLPTVCPISFLWPHNSHTFHLNSSLRLTDKLSPPCTMSAKLLSVFTVACIWEAVKTKISL